VLWFSAVSVIPQNLHTPFSLICNRRYIILAVGSVVK
jgi:hypothetical protein